MADISGKDHGLDQGHNFLPFLCRQVIKKSCLLENGLGLAAVMVFQYTSRLIRNRCQILFWLHGSVTHSMNVGQMTGGIDEVTLVYTFRNGKKS